MPETRTYIYSCRVIPQEERDVAHAHQRDPYEMHPAEVGEIRQLSVNLTDEGAEAYSGASNLIEIEEETTAHADGWVDAELAEDEAGAANFPAIPHTEDTDYGRSTWLREGKRGAGVKVAVLDTALGAPTARMLENYIVGHKSWVGGSALSGTNDHGCITPEHYVFTTLCGAETIEQAFDTANIEFGSEPSTVGGYPSFSSYPARDVYTVGYDPESGEGQRTRIAAFHKLHYRGNLVEIRCGGNTFRLTPWNKVLRNASGGDRSCFKAVRADELKPGQNLKLPEEVKLKEGGTGLDARLLYLMGVAAGDGYVSKSRLGLGMSGSVELSHADYALPVIEDLELDHHRTPDGKRICVYTPLWRPCVEHGIGPGAKATTLSLPKAIASTDDLWPFLAGYIDADGCVHHKYHSLRISTSSERMAKQLVAVLNSRGITTRAWSQDDTRVRSIGSGKPTRSTALHWQVYISNGALSTLLDRIGSYIRNKTFRDVPHRKRTNRTRIKEVRSIPYEGWLYDISTDAGWYAASNRHSAIISNSHCACTALPDRAKLLHGAVLKNSGSGGTAGIIAAIHWAVESGADIISMSLSGRGNEGPYEQAIRRARSRGVLVFCAAGNEAEKGNPKRFPGGCASSIAVGAFDRKTDRRASFSCFGAHVDIAHSGVGVLSYSARGTLIRMSGTSQATPNAVWAAAGLQAETGKKGDALYAGLLSGARRNGSPVTHYGAGIVDGKAARTKLLTALKPPEPEKPDRPHRLDKPERPDVPEMPDRPRKLFPRLEGR